MGGEKGFPPLMESDFRMFQARNNNFSRRCSAPSLAKTVTPAVLGGREELVPNVSYERYFVTTAVRRSLHWAPVGKRHTKYIAKRDLCGLTSDQS